MAPQTDPQILRICQRWCSPGAIAKRTVAHELEARGKRDVDGSQNVLPDGMVRHIHAVGHQVFDASGEPSNSPVRHVDVTPKRKRAEEERERLRQLEADLAHMDRVSMMGELTASLSHEIKQPIAAAITNANTSLRWLRRDPPNVEAREAALRVVKRRQPCRGDHRSHKVLL